MNRSVVLRILLPALVLVLPLLLSTQWKSQIDYARRSGEILEVRVWPSPGVFQRFDLITNPELPIEHGYYKSELVYRAEVSGHAPRLVVVWEDLEYTKSAETELGLGSAELSPDNSYWLVGIRPVYQESEEETGLVVIDAVDVTGVLLRGNTYRHFSSIKRTTYILLWDFLVPLGVPLLVVILIISALWRKPLRSQNTDLDE